jgi:hypothetical protein
MTVYKVELNTKKQFKNSGLEEIREEIFITYFRILL